MATQNNILSNFVLKSINKTSSQTRCQVNFHEGVLRASPCTERLSHIKLLLFHRVFSLAFIDRSVLVWNHRKMGGRARRGYEPGVTLHMMWPNIPVSSSCRRVYCGHLVAWCSTAAASVKELLRVILPPFLSVLFSSQIGLTDHTEAVGEGLAYTSAIICPYWSREIITGSGPSHFGLCYLSSESSVHDATAAAHASDPATWARR